MPIFTSDERILRNRIDLPLVSEREVLPIFTFDEKIRRDGIDLPLVSERVNPLDQRSARGIVPPRLRGSSPVLDPEKTGPPLHKKRPIRAMILEPEQSQPQLNPSKRSRSIAPPPLNP